MTATRAARVCVGMCYCGQLWSVCIFMGVCSCGGPYACIRMCNQREVAPAGEAALKLHFYLGIVQAVPGKRRSVGVRVERMVCCWLPLLTRTAFIN